jgi:hypothetical protein
MSPVVFIVASPSCPTLITRLKFASALEAGETFFDPFRAEPPADWASDLPASRRLKTNAAHKKEKIMYLAKVF